jgi:hypothetical protein
VTHTLSGTEFGSVGSTPGAKNNVLWKTALPSKTTNIGALLSHGFVAPGSENDRAVAKGAVSGRAG